jgi:hypothetical protein
VLRTGEGTTPLPLSASAYASDKAETIVSFSCGVTPPRKYRAASRTLSCSSMRSLIQRVWLAEGNSMTLSLDERLRARPTRTPSTQTMTQCCSPR